MGMASPEQIVKFWENEFELDPDFPQCFACGYSFRSWSNRGLQRCHLISRQHWGEDGPDNLILLCVRCHREAPMVGISRFPMLSWAHNREFYLTWALHTLYEETESIESGLLMKMHKVAEKMGREAFQASIVAAFDYLKITYHPGGTSGLASLAQALHLVTKYEGHRCKI